MFIPAGTGTEPESPEHPTLPHLGNYKIKSAAAL